MVPAEVRMLLHPGYRRFQQVRKKKREEQDKDSAPRQIKDSHRGQEQPHGGDHVSSFIVNPEHASPPSISKAPILINLPTFAARDCIPIPSSNCYPLTTLSLTTWMITSCGSQSRGSKIVSTPSMISLPAPARRVHYPRACSQERRLRVSATAPASTSLQER